MTTSKVAKKFHLDSDGYLTTKPDRQLTTEEEATSAAEAAIDEALEEGGAIAEAIAASGGGMIVRVNYEIGSTSSDGSTALNILSVDKSYDDIKEAIDSGSPVICIAQEQNAQSPYPMPYEALPLNYYTSEQTPTNNPVFAFTQYAGAVFVNPSQPQGTIVTSKTTTISIGKLQSSGKLEQGMVTINQNTSS